MATRNGGMQLKASEQPYFYGRITRDEAEELLKASNSVEGMFLLRESISPLGNYAISLCHECNVHHYQIEKHTDGMYMIPSGKKFLGPVELIQHHQRNKDGIITLLTIGCDRHSNQQPIAFRGITYPDFEQELLRKAHSIKGVNRERALGAQREHLVIMVARELHTKQPWYHGKISRDEAANRLQRAGHKNGKFMVRMRDDKKTFAVCVSYSGDTRHYLISNDNDKMRIQDGPKFDCVMMLIDHYHNKQDGLLCKLTEPCPNPGFNPDQLRNYMENNRPNLDYYLPGPGLPSAAAPPVPSSAFREKLSVRTSTRRPLPPTPVVSNMSTGDWEGAESHNRGAAGRTATLQRLGIKDPERLEDIYGSVPRTMKDFDLKREQIKIEETLGAGQFGSVCKGMCTLRSKEKIPVAIKTLKKEECNSQQEPELMKEAKIMMPLSHKNIVRMIGVCKAENIMLVLELAPLGPLNSFLQNHKDLSQVNIVELLMQVAMGMAYLEANKFVHRDLAARNVLLVTEHFAKISDFGMSKAVGRDNNYYEAKEAGKWPLKWYAPECVYYWRFDSKSDVWSYGVTMWEATSYGEKPYRGMRGQEILKFLVEEEKRLVKPDQCNDEVYDIMLHCWQYEKNERPTFSELSAQLSNLHQRLNRSRR